MPFVPIRALLTDPLKDGRRYFTMTYLADNYNAAGILVTDMKTNPVFAAAKKAVHFSTVTLVHGATLGVALTLGFNWLGGSNFFIRLITTNADDTSGQIPLDITMSPETLRTEDGYWFNVGAVGFAATDDMSLLFTGWIE